MPLILRILLTIFPALLLAYAYSGWKFYHAFINTFPSPDVPLALYMIGAISYLNLYPLVLIILHSLKLEKLKKPVIEGNRLWDIFLAYPFWLGLIVVVEILPWLLIIDLIKLPFYPFFDRFRSDWLQIQYRVTLALFCLFTVYVLFRVIIDTTRVKVSEIVLSYRNLPSRLQGLKIIHISDVQADPRTRQRKLKRYVKKVNGLRPDVVFFTGDLVSSGRQYIGLGANILAGINAEYGTYACLGDHDFWAGGQEVMDRLYENHITVLQDKNQLIGVRNQSLLVTFITNTYDHRPNLDNLSFLMGQQPRGVLDIVITHQPTESIVELAAERGYHIFLAGHTHGGQIIFKLFGLNLTPAKIETPFYKGFHYVGGMLVSVNNGLGLTLVPIRYRAAAEVTSIRVVRRPD